MSVPRCEYCGRTLFGRYAKDYWGIKYCPEHRGEYASCEYCGRLIPPEDMEQGLKSDDAIRCPRCRKRAIESVEKAEPIFHHLVAWVSSQGLSFSEKTLVIELCDRGKLNTQDKHCFGYTVIMAQYSPQGVVKKVKGVSILRGLPYTLFRGVTLHELGHAWLTNHQVDNMPDWGSEGFCELLRYMYLQQMDTHESHYYMMMMEKNSHPLYGDGFRRLRRLSKNLGFAELLRYLKDNKRLPS